MAKDLTVMLGDRPGSLAGACEALGRAGINIEGASAFPREGGGVAHFLVEDAAGARRALEEVGYSVEEERDVLVTELEDRPGAAGEALRRIADAGVSLDLAYVATRTRLVVGAAELEKARGAL